MIYSTPYRNNYYASKFLFKFSQTLGNLIMIIGKIFKIDFIVVGVLINKKMCAILCHFGTSDEFFWFFVNPYRVDKKIKKFFFSKTHFL